MSARIENTVVRTASKLLATVESNTEIQSIPSRQKKFGYQVWDDRSEKSAEG
jgi:hypothetical protein